MSVAVLNVPRVVDMVTASPPVVRLLPFMSSSCTVMVEVEVPSAVREAGAAVISEVAAEATPGVKLTVELSEMDDPFAVPVMVAVPVVVAEVSVAV